MEASLYVQLLQKKIMMKDEDIMILMYVFYEECVHQEEENSDHLAGLLLLRG